MSIIKRIGYLEHIKTYINKDLIKVFVGQRRVGKSYLMKMTANYILEINPQTYIVPEAMQRFFRANWPHC